MEKTLVKSEKIGVKIFISKYHLDIQTFESKTPHSKCLVF